MFFDAWDYAATSVWIGFQIILSASTVYLVFRVVIPCWTIYIENRNWLGRKILDFNEKEERMAFSRCLSDVKADLKFILKRVGL